MHFIVHFIGVRNDAGVVVSVSINVQEGNVIENRFQTTESYGYGFGHGMNEYYQPAPVSLDDVLSSCIISHSVSPAMGGPGSS